MAWIEVHDTLREHRKTYALAEALKIPHFAAGGLLVFLWTWAINNAQDGDLSRFPDSAIARACFWAKSPSKLVEALTACGWLSEQRMIHDWALYAGRLIAKREANAQRNRIARETSASHDTHEAHTDRTSSASCMGATVPNLTVPNHTGVPPLPPTGERDGIPADVPRKSDGSPLDTMFDTFWDAYPRKVAKAAALKAFLKIKPDGELMDLILAKLKTYKKTEQWTKDGGEFIPNASTWLNQKRWEDDIPEHPAKKGKRVSFQNYNQDQGVEQDIPIGLDVIAEARKLRELNAAEQ